jgi:hypothetical protein
MGMDYNSYLEVVCNMSPRLPSVLEPFLGDHSMKQQTAHTGLALSSLCAENIQDFP